MRPELISIPFINYSLPSYGPMMVLGFMSAILLARYFSRKLGQDPEHITNFAVYAMVAGVLGARFFHVIHYWDSRYSDNPFEIFAIWNGGLEFLGGFIGALAVMIVYFKRKKLPTLKFLDILAPALMLGLSFGRIGCFMNGCCFGAPTDLPWAVRFPSVNYHPKPIGGFDKDNARYNVPFRYSLAFDSQIHINEQRRPGQPPRVILPDEYYQGYTNGQGRWVDSKKDIPAGMEKVFFPVPKPPYQLTDDQLKKLQDGTYQMIPVHPTQIYSLLNVLTLALVLCILMRYRRYDGWLFGLMLIFYGATRFGLEALRDDNPLEFTGLTISQNISVAAIIGGLALLIIAKKISTIRR
jgi:phosphatidylglycerol---prolipoprotein diacylglyceryl transferase